MPFSIRTIDEHPELKAIWPDATCILFILDGNGEPVSARGFKTLMAAGQFAADRWPERHP